MIDPSNITNYNLNKVESEEVLLFWLFAAGHNANSTARGLDKFLRNRPPFAFIRKTPIKELESRLKAAGLGCYKKKAIWIKELANANLDLAKCSVKDLVSIRGIGPKTARCFLIHSRKNVRLAGLDVHVLRYLSEKGHDVPRNTPGSEKKYEKIENLFLDLADKSGMSVAEFDLLIWNTYSRKQKLAI